MDLTQLQGECLQKVLNERIFCLGWNASWPPCLWHLVAHDLVPQHLCVLGFLDWVVIYSPSWHMPCHIPPYHSLEAASFHPLFSSACTINNTSPAGHHLRCYHRQSNGIPPITGIDYREMHIVRLNDLFQWALVKNFDILQWSDLKPIILTALPFKIVSSPSFSIFFKWTKALV